MPNQSQTHSLSQTLITGVYRTGSEYIAQLASCHPEISVSMYSVNVLRFVYGRYDPVSDPAQCKRALADMADRLQARYQRTLDCGLVMSALEHMGQIDYGTFYDAVMCALHLTGSSRHWAEKNQLLWREIPQFLEMMPNGKAILVIRDPRSVLASFRKYTYAAPPAYLGAVFNCVDAMQCALEYQRTLDPEKFLLVRYEDAARAPQNVADKIWRFLKLSGGYEVTNPANWRDAYGKQWHANSSFHSNDDARPFDIESSINRWVSELSPAELSLVEGVCAETMAALGYEPSLTSGPDWLSAIRLFIHDPQVTEYFKLWTLKGKGIEAFPTDPLNSKNWRE